MFFRSKISPKLVSLLLNIFIFQRLHARAGDSESGEEPADYLESRDAQGNQVRGAGNH